jgi:hypothetical protein
LENKIIALGADPKYPIVFEDMIKKMDTNIKALKKKLHILEVQHVKTLELQASFEENEQLFFQLNEKDEENT